MSVGKKLLRGLPHMEDVCSPFKKLSITLNLMLMQMSSHLNGWLFPTKKSLEVATLEKTIFTREPQAHLREAITTRAFLLGIKLDEFM